MTEDREGMGCGKAGRGVGPAGPWLRTPVERRLRLAGFGMEVGRAIASGDADRLLAASDADGSHPVVVALGEEPAVLLVERIMAVGGRATVFVRCAEGVTVLAADLTTPVGASGVSDLMRDGRSGGEPTVDAFLASLSERPRVRVLGRFRIGR